MITVTFYGSLAQELNFYLEVLASLHWVIYFSWNQSWMALSASEAKTSVNARTPAKAVDTLYAQICLRTSRHSHM